MAKTPARAGSDRGRGRQGKRQRKNAVAGGIMGLAVVAVALVAYLTISASGPRRTSTGLVATGEQGPDFSLPRLRGAGSVSLADFKGRVVLMNFWHSQ